MSKLIVFITAFVFSSSCAHSSDFIDEFVGKNEIVNICDIMPFMDGGSFGICINKGGYEIFLKFNKQLGNADKQCVFDYLGSSSDIEKNISSSKMIERGSEL